MAITNYHTVNGELIGETTSSVRTGYLTDGLGSVTATQGSTRNGLTTYRYKPYGGLLAKTGSGTDPRFLWTGELGARTSHQGLLYLLTRHSSHPVPNWTSRPSTWPIDSPYAALSLRSGGGPQEGCKVTSFVVTPGGSGAQGATGVCEWERKDDGAYYLRAYMPVYFTCQVSCPSNVSPKCEMAQLARSRTETPKFGVVPQKWFKDPSPLCQPSPIGKYKYRGVDAPRKCDDSKNPALGEKPLMCDQDNFSWIKEMKWATALDIDDAVPLDCFVEFRTCCACEKINIWNVSVPDRPVPEAHWDCPNGQEVRWSIHLKIPDKNVNSCTMTFTAGS